MTDKEKLQHLFDAALRAPTSNPEGPPQRAFPDSAAPQVPAPSHAVAAIPALPDPAADPEVETADATPAAPALDKAAADALGALLDEKNLKQTRRRRLEVLVTATVVIGLIGGGLGWFVQSPERVEGFTSAMREIRSAGDAKSLAAKYQKALDRTAARGRQIDQASAALGVTESAVADKSAGMDAEMEGLMGGEGRTTSQRDLALRKSFGAKANEHGGPLKPSLAAEGEDAFQY